MRDDLFYFPFDSMRFPFNVEVCGYTADDANTPHVEIRENCYMYLCEYIINGSGYLMCNGKEYYPKAGDVYILPKGSNHTYYPNPEDPWEKIWFIFDGLLVPNILHGFRLQKDVLFRNFGHSDFFYKILNMAKAGPKSDLQEFNFKFGMQFCELLFLLNKHKTTLESTDVAERVQAILDANIYKTLNLDIVSEKLFLSKTHIINLFRKKFGITPYQYFLQQKISIAADFLANSKYSVNEISQLLSFSDHQYFCRIFKKTTGISPLQYRKSSDTLTYKWAHERASRQGFLNNWDFSNTTQKDSNYPENTEEQF